MHPSLAELLGSRAEAGSAPSPALAAHLGECAACQRLLTLASGRVAAEDPGQAGSAVAVERGLFTDWRALHAGGMGRIFSAWDVRLGREVALKVLPDASECPDPAWRAELERRFDQEARRTARLDHPSIVAIHEAGCFTDGEPFYVMRLIRGEPLDRAIAARTTLVARLGLLPHLIAAAEAVAYAHDQGVVHRDLKPQNLMVGRFGETVVIDWGLSRQIGVEDAEPGSGPTTSALADTPGTFTRMGVGTPHYMPPEQAEGTPGNPRMDVYALGATLYHLLAGVPPYGEGAASAVRARLLVGPPTPLETVVPGVPPALADITRKCMARAPEERFSDALELARELHRFGRGELTRTHRYSAWERAGLWARRHRAAVVAGGAGLAFAVGLGVLSLDRIVSERNAAEAARAEALTQAAATESALERARGSLASRLALQPERRLEALALAVGAVGAALGREEAPADEALAGLYDALAAGPALRLLRGKGPRVAAMAFDPTGDVLFTLADDATAQIWDARTGHLRATAAPGPLRPTSVQFSPTGRNVLATGGGARPVLWSEPQVATGPTALPGAPLLGLTSTVSDARFSGDGSVVVGADLQGHVAIWDVPSGRLRAEHSVEGGVSMLGVAPDGRVFLAVPNGEIEVWTPGGGALRFQAAGAVINGLALSRDARRLLVCGADDRLVEYALGEDGRPSGPAKLLMGEPGNDCFGMVTAGDLDVLAVGLGGARLRRKGARQPFWPVVGGFMRVAAFDKEGEHFVGSADWLGECRLYETRHGAMIARLPTGGAAPSLDCTLSPDAGRVAQASGTGELFLMDARRGWDSGSLDRLDAEVMAVGRIDRHLFALSVDGRWRYFGLPDLADRRHRSTGTVPVALDRGATGDAWVVMGLSGDVDVLGSMLDPPLLSLEGPPVQGVCRFGLPGARGILRLERGVAVHVDGPGEPRRGEKRVFASPPTAMACTSAGAVIGLQDGRVVRHVGSGHEQPVELWSEGIGGGVRRLAASRDEAWLALSGEADSTRATHRDGTRTVLWPGRLLELTSAAVPQLVTATAEGLVFAGPVDAPPRRLPSVGGPVSTSAVSDDGAFLAVGGADGALRVFALEEARLLFRILRPEGGFPTALTFIANAAGEPFVVAGHSDGELRLYPVTPRGAVAAACARLMDLGAAMTPPGTREGSCAPAPPAPP